MSGTASEIRLMSFSCIVDIACGVTIYITGIYKYPVIICYPRSRATIWKAKGKLADARTTRS